MIKKTYWIIFLLLALVSCDKIKQWKDSDRVPIMYSAGSVLYYDEVLSLMPADISAEDSANFVDTYKKHWALNTLIYSNALKNIGSPKYIDEMAENYRRELIINEYQQQIVAQNTVKADDDSLMAYYELNKNHFPLDFTIVKCIFIKVQTRIQGKDELVGWLTDINDDNLENCMRFCTKSAIQYEFLNDVWTPFEKISILLPEPLDGNSDMLKKGLLEFKTEEYTYLLQILDICKKGEPQPYEMIFPKIKHILDNQQKINFLKEFQSQMYQKALKDGEIHDIQIKQY